MIPLHPESLAVHHFATSPLPALPPTPPPCSLEKLRELSKESATAIGNNATALGNNLSLSTKWVSPQSSSLGAGGTSAADASKGEEGSDSGPDAGPEEGSTWGVSSMLRGGNVASRLGLGAVRSSEKEQLVPKCDTDGSAGSSFSRFELPSWQPGLGRLNELSSSMRSGLGMEKPKIPEGRVARLVYFCTNLTYKQRMLGFSICFALGTILSLSALNSLGGLLLGNPGPFAFKYTAGNLLAIGSSSFLVGPSKQCRDMLSPERRFVGPLEPSTFVKSDVTHHPLDGCSMASLVYLGTLVGTLISVFVIKVQLLSFALVICQFIALTWYMLSYVPYGQQCLRRTLARLC